MSNTTTAAAATRELVSAEEIAKFQYLADKPVSSLHEALAAYILETSGIEISEKQVQAVLSIHGTFQKSEANKNRAEYKARTAASIRNGGQTTAERFAELARLEAESLQTAAPEETTEVATETAEAAAEVEAPKPAAKPRRTRKTAAEKKAEAEAAELVAAE